MGILSLYKITAYNNIVCFLYKHRICVKNYRRHNLISVRNLVKNLSEKKCLHVYRPIGYLHYSVF